RSRLAGRTARPGRRFRRAAPRPGAPRRAAGRRPSAGFAESVGNADVGGPGAAPARTPARPPALARSLQAPCTPAQAARGVRMSTDSATNRLRAGLRVEDHDGVAIGQVLAVWEDVGTSEAWGSAGSRLVEGAEAHDPDEFAWSEAMPGEGESYF